MTLQLGGRLALDPAQLAEEDAPPADPPALLPLLAVVLLGVDPQVGQRGEACGERRRRRRRRMVRNT